MSSTAKARRVRTPQCETLEPRLFLSAAPLADPWIEQAAVPIVVPVPEAESLGGPSNDAPADAQALTFNYLLPAVSPTPGFGPQQAAVTGTADGSGQPAEIYLNSAAVGGRISGTVAYRFTLDQAIAPGGDGQLTLLAWADLAGPDKYLIVDIEGVYQAEVHFEYSPSAGLYVAELTIPREQLELLAADGAINLTATASPAMAPTTGGFIDVTLQYAGPGGSGTSDYYAIDLAAGDMAALTLAGGTGTMILELYAADGSLLAEGTAVGAVTAISDYMADASGIYYVRIAGDGHYTLTVDRNATVEQPINADFASAQTINGPLVDGRQWAVGALDGLADRDYFAIDLAGGGKLDVTAYLPGGAPGKKAVAPVLRLYDAGGNLVAEGQAGSLSYRVASGAGGTYYVEIAGDVAGPYVLGFKRTGPNPAETPPGNAYGKIKNGKVVETLDLLPPAPAKRGK